MVRRNILILVFFLGMAILPSCGKKGPLLPPLIRVPKTVEELELRQQGDTIILTWTNPSAYVDGNPLPFVSEVEIWLAEGSELSEHAAEEIFPENARLLAKIPASRWSPLLEKGRSRGAYFYAFIPKKGEAKGKFEIFSLRVRDDRGRISGFSEPKGILVRDAPEPPGGVRALVRPDSIELLWDPPAMAADAASVRPLGYDVYRRESDEPPVLLNSSPVEGSEYRDTGIVFGRTYRYTVRTVILGFTPLVESDDSIAVDIEARDVFPPAAPTGLSAVAGPGLIALSWEIGPEPDLAGFRVWRKENSEAEFLLLKELAATENSYTDSGVEKSRRYVYAITAFDAAGNESSRSALVSGAVRDGPV